MINKKLSSLDWYINQMKMIETAFEKKKITATTWHEKAKEIKQKAREMHFEETIQSQVHAIDEYATSGQFHAETQYYRTFINNIND